MSTDKMPHQWALANHNTEKLRNCALTLTNQISNLEVAGGQRTERDAAIIDAINNMAMAADHIDRLEDKKPPHFVQISADNNILVGLDAAGGVWELLAEGWVRIPLVTTSSKVGCDADN